MQRYYAVCKKPIPLGYAGENLAREIAFDIGELRSIYGEGSAQLMVRRTGEDVRYPVPLTVDGNFAIWSVTEADSAIPGCDGSCELSYTTENGVLAKSETWATFVLASMTCDTCDPPEVAETWMDALRKSAAETQFNADSAAASAATAEEWAKIAEGFANGGGGSGGGTGENGKDGKDGITPHIGENGNWFLGNTDTGIKAKGEDGKDGEDGQDGSDGITPHIGENKNWFIGETDTGVKAEGKDGSDGKDGTDGKDGISADFYSTEETVVGTWIDGKPIYRIVGVCSVELKANTLTQIADVARLNIDTLVFQSVHTDGSANYGTATSATYRVANEASLFVGINPTKTTLYGNNTLTKAVRATAFVIEYTKTTDTATIDTTALMNAYDKGVNEA